MEMNKRLYRSDANRVLGGVCGGLGDYLGISPVILRIFFILWMILGEFSILVYMILWLVIPRQGDMGTFRTEDLGVHFRQLGQDIGDVFHEPGSQLITYAGISLIVWGVYNLLGRLGVHLFPVQYTQYLWPVLLIVAGAFVLFRTLTKKK